jgi:uncharacterized protein (DUF924 family)
VTESDIITFWFEETSAKQRFAKDADFDQLIRDRFLAVHDKAQRGLLVDWRVSAPGALAEIIVLDQFSRNLYRDQPDAFANDGLALVLAQEAIRRQLDQQLEPAKRAFIYMPFMHSEALEMHERAVELFSQPGLEEQLRFEHRHKAIIERFGRYPHRNETLGRDSTAEELSFLQEPGSSF